MRAQFPGVNDQNSLNTLGRQYGLIDAKPPVPAKGSHGKERLAVLARAFTDELLDMAGELKDEPDDP